MILLLLLLLSLFFSIFVMVKEFLKNLKVFVIIIRMMDHICDVMLKLFVIKKIFEAQLFF
jgi:hypothetical protein